jgi:hypothetical protein
MPKGSDWINFIYVNLGFISQVVAMYYFSALVDIKNNWPLYRCNPMYMPLSDNISQDFTYCVQNTQMNLMGYLLQPLTYVTSNLTALSGELGDSIGYSTNMLGNVRTYFSSLIGSIFSAFLNMIIEIQRLIIGIKDTLGKIVGIMTATLYILDGSYQTISSAWNGPPGQMVKSLGSGTCFLPETKIKLDNGKIVPMKEVQAGDVLENGSRVQATMKLENRDLKENLYVIKNKGVGGEDIYVTGSHMVYTGSKFVRVDAYEKAELQKEVKCEWFSSLITYDHKIQIGEQLFWDWDDDCLHQ